MKVIKKEVNVVYDIKDLPEEDLRTIKNALEYYLNRYWRGSREVELLKKLNNVN